MLLQDPWHQMRSFVDNFNDCRRHIIEPGWCIVCDECMSPWEGLEQKYCHCGCPHITKIARKPKGVGVEFKSAADGPTGILIYLEIQEGAERMQNKTYSRQYGASTAVTLRLTSNWFETKRTIIADSWFSSVKTLIQLRNRGLFFMGLVKTAHKQYPMKFLERWAGALRREERGSHKLLMAYHP